MKNVAVEEKQSSEGLVLGAGGDVTVDGQMGEESFDLGGAHVDGVAEAFRSLVEADVLLNPAEVALFGAEGEAANAEGLTDLFEELHGNLLSMGAGRAVRESYGVIARCAVLMLYVALRESAISISSTPERPSSQQKSR